MAINIFDGSSWNQYKKIHVHDGSSWRQSVAAYIWDGTQWKLFSTGVPVNTEVPTLSSSTSLFNSLSTLQPGDVLSTGNGIWENEPTSYTYKWYKKIAGSTLWQEIQGESSSSITLTENTLPIIKYVGYSLKSEVIAKNLAGDSIEIFSAETGHVLPKAISNISATVKSNDIVEIVFPKSIGANDYYMQYDGPDLDFVEILSLANNTRSNVTYDTSDNYNIKITLDLGNADGSLGFLINPIRIDGSIKHTGYGSNGSVNNLKINPAGVLASISNASITGATFNWSYSGNITPSSWELYDGAEIVTISAVNSVQDTSYSLGNLSPGGSTYGSYYIKVFGTAPRHNQTQWTSNTVSVTVPEVPTPVNTLAPVISSSNGRVFSVTEGTWTNTQSIYSYVYDWKSNGQPLSFAAETTLDLGTSTEYDGTSITCQVSVVTTDLRLIAGMTSNSITAQTAPTTPTTFIVPNFVGGAQPPSTDNYTIAIGTDTVTGTSSLWGTVATQDKEAGSSQSVGTTITLSIYVSAPAPFFPPTFYNPPSPDFPPFAPPFFPPFFPPSFYQPPSPDFPPFAPPFFPPFFPPSFYQPPT
jgi:hypothetical protein